MSYINEHGFILSGDTNTTVGTWWLVGGRFGFYAEEKETRKILNKLRLTKIPIMKEGKVTSRALSSAPLDDIRQVLGEENLVLVTDGTYGANLDKVYTTQETLRDDEPMRTIYARRFYVMRSADNKVIATIHLAPVGWEYRDAVDDKFINLWKMNEGKDVEIYVPTDTFGGDIRGLDVVNKPFNLLGVAEMNEFLGDNGYELVSAVALETLKSFKSTS